MKFVATIHSRLGDQGVLIVHVAFLVALLIAVNPALAQSKQETAAHNKGAVAKQRGSRDNPLFVDILPAPDADKRTKEDQEERDAKKKADVKLVEFTGQLAEYTDKLAGYTKYLVGIGIVQCSIFILQLIVFGLQAKRLRETVDLGRAEFNAIHYPRVEIRRLQLRWSDSQKGINFVVANTGEAGASNIRANINIRVVSNTMRHELEKESLPFYGNEWIDVSEQIKKPILKARERAFIFVPFSQEIDATTMEQVNRGEQILFFFGIVDFFDPDKVRRDSGFFRIYNGKTTKKFEDKKDDPDYEWN